MENYSQVLHYYPPQYESLPRHGFYPVAGELSTQSADSHNAEKSYEHTKPYFTNLDDDDVKRPMNSFLLWAKTMRRKYANENPNLHNAEISKLLGKIWNSMSTLDKRPFVERAEKLRVIHMRNYPNYRYAPKKKKDKKSHRMISPEVAVALHHTLFDVNNIISGQLNQNQDLFSQDLKSFGYLRNVCENKNVSSNNFKTAAKHSFHRNVVDDRTADIQVENITGKQTEKEVIMKGHVVPDISKLQSDTSHEVENEKIFSSDATGKPNTVASMTLHYYPTLKNHDIHKMMHYSDNDEITSSEDKNNSLTIVFAPHSDNLFLKESSSETDEKPKNESLYSDIPDFLQSLIDSPLHMSKDDSEGTDALSLWSDIGDIIGFNDNLTYI